MGNAGDYRQRHVLGFDRAFQWRRHRRPRHHLLGAAGDEAGMDHAGRDDDDANLGPEHARQRHAHRVERGLGGAVDDRAAGAGCAAPEEMLMMTPSPDSRSSGTKARIVAKGPRTLAVSTWSIRSSSSASRSLCATIRVNPAEF